MSVGIPCCKTFIIHVNDSTVDCGGVTTDITHLVWTPTNVGTSGNGTINLAGAGTSGTFSFSGSTLTDIVNSTGQLVAPICNRLGTIKNIRLTFSIDYDIQAGSAELNDAHVIILGFSRDVTEGPATDSGSGVIYTYHIGLPACSVSNITIQFDGYATNFGPDFFPGSFSEYNCSGSFSVALLP